MGIINVNINSMFTVQKTKAQQVKWLIRHKVRKWRYLNSATCLQSPFFYTSLPGFPTILTPSPSVSSSPTSLLHKLKLKSQSASYQKRLVLTDLETAWEEMTKGHRASSWACHFPLIAFTPLVAPLTFSSSCKVSFPFYLLQRSTFPCRLNHRLGTLNGVLADGSLLPSVLSFSPQTVL